MLIRQTNVHAVLGGLLLALAAAPASSQPEDLYRWTAPSAERQLAADTTTLAAGQGAVFVPTMTNGLDEPEVLIYAADERVATGRTGERIALQPGTYDVRVGSGTTEQMTSTSVTVRAGQTMTVEPIWGGLVIEVVDENNVPHRGTYEIIRDTDREVLGIGYGADTLQAETLRTWLLKPGLYRIVRTGETYRARRDFTTVNVPEADLVHFKLVTDPVTGNFRGAGVVSAEDVGVVVEGERPWTRRVTLGGAVSLNTTDDVVGASNQSTLSGLAFFDTYLTYDSEPHLATTIFEVEEGLLSIDPEVGEKLPTQVTQDRVRFDTVYTRFITERWGPYARLGFLTNAFPAEVLAVDDVTVAFNRLDGSTDLVFVPANDQYRIADSLGSLRVREGVGANFRLIRNRWADVNWRAGVGFRQNQFNDAFVLIDDPATDELEYFEVDDFDEEGIETTLSASVRLLRNLIYITDLEVFADFDETGDPTIDWRNTVSLRLTRTLSIDYTLDILDQPQVSDETQSRQNILLRLSFDIL